MTTRSLISSDPRITAIWPDDGESGVEHDTVIPHDGDQQQWKLVPVTPTPEMLAAVSWPGCAATDYAHMLAAAPQPPSAQADAIEAAEKAEPVAWLEGPYGEFRANPGYRIAAPQSVAWSIPLYAGTPEDAR